MKRGWTAFCQAYYEAERVQQKNHPFGNFDEKRAQIFFIPNKNL